MSIKQLNVRISEELIKDFKYFALENDTNINTLVERALEFYLLCQSDVSLDKDDSINLDSLNKGLQWYLLNNSMRIELSEGATDLKLKALSDLGAYM